MIRWHKPKSIGYRGAFGLSVKVGYWLLTFQKGCAISNWPVCGDVFSVYFFISTKHYKRIFIAYWGYLERRAVR